MKRFLILFLAISIWQSSSAQKINYLTSFNDAVNTAEKKHKPILVIIDAPANKQQINFAIDDADVSNKINKDFIVYKTYFSDSSARTFISKYKLNSFPAYLFLHSNKDLFYKDSGSSTLKDKYLTMIEKALDASKERSLSDLEKDYLKNKSNVEALKKYIDARKKIGLTNNAGLIEQYVNYLKIGDLNNYQTVLYILEAGPYSDGLAYKMAYTNRKIVDSLYKTESSEKRSAINNRIINNTMSSAIKTKNSSRAQSAANFSRNTWSNDYIKGTKAQSLEMIKYYAAIKDTANYFRTATYYYDGFYMNLSTDSIRKIEQKNNALSHRPTNAGTAKTLSKEKLDSLSKNTKNVIYTKTTFSAYSSYALDLNNVAYMFYQMGTNNINHLTKAMLWSRRSIELDQRSAYYDTLAHILYKMGYNEQAIKTQQTAIDKAKEERVSYTHYEGELKKIIEKNL